MFGVTTPCVQARDRRLEADYDCLVFHATGIGGRSMENLGDSGLLAGASSISPRRRSPTCSSAACSRRPRTASARRSAPRCPMSARSARSTWSISARATPCRRNSAAGKFVIHNPNVTLMRTTRDENRAFGEWIGERLNAMNGPVRFLLPEGGVSMLDAPGKPFHDPEADNALFEALEKTVRADAAAPGRARAAPTSTTTPFVDARWSTRSTRSRRSCRGGREPCATRRTLRA